jgi:DNA-binding transcriptional LysR family regulator
VRALRLTEEGSLTGKGWRGERAIELRHLRYFVSVAEFLNFGRAATALHIAQPSLSRQIHDLEDRLEVKLFDRTARGVSLTYPGALLLAESRHILEEFSLSLRRVRDVLDPEHSQA